MRVSKLDYALYRYEAALAEIERAGNNLSPELILSALIARDTVQAALTNLTQVPKSRIITVIQLDTRLKELAKQINQTVQLPDYHASLNPSAQAWWWSLQDPPHPWDRFDYLWNAIIFLCFTACVSLLINLCTRFLSGGPDFVSSIVVGIQGAITLLAANNVLSEAGRTVVEKALSRIGTPFRQASKLALSLIALILLLLFQFNLPNISTVFTNWGTGNFLNGDLASAMSNYERAISLDPDNAWAHYGLGRVYEEIQDVDKARTQYRLAVGGGMGGAYSDLGRLYIQDKKYSEAAALLRSGLEKENNDQERYSLLKNLGWARFQQERYDEAESRLREAIEIPLDVERGHAYCLLAQVLEKQALEDAATEDDLPFWQKCLKHVNPKVPWEDAWVNEARKHVFSQEKD